MRNPDLLICAAEVTETGVVRPQELGEQALQRAPAASGRQSAACWRGLARLAWVCAFETDTANKDEGRPGHPMYLRLSGL